jgi:hypothetical protein
VGGETSFVASNAADGKGHRDAERGFDARQPDHEPADALLIDERKNSKRGLVINPYPQKAVNSPLASTRVCANLP